MTTTNLGDSMNLVRIITTTSTVLIPLGILYSIWYFLIAPAIININLVLK